ncbi:metalloprotease [Halobacteriales archaeon SW_7_68_16]|nr:MAG: metalloprotease [Halobacteriales archaeon SW_7_68_16]
MGYGHPPGDPGVEFGRRELLDLAAAWIALSLAFTLFLQPRALRQGAAEVLAVDLGINLATVGVAFLLHELAHKVIAVRFGQMAAFRADYNMLFLAVMGGFIGFIFAAPGAVYHRGRITARENGLIALAGPVTNLVLAAVFAAIGLGLVADGGRLASRGVSINLFLAAFNMLPVGPLDGKSVLGWNPVVFTVVFLPSLALGLAVFVGAFGLGLRPT